MQVTDSEYAENTPFFKARKALSFWLLSLKRTNADAQKTLIASLAIERYSSLCTSRDEVKKSTNGATITLGFVENFNPYTQLKTYCMG
ncbi:hypothetical protein OH492_08035 [Vibrio chagasii]|nr:hypothetical protein [Vibrio chagasii]